MEPTGMIPPGAAAIFAGAIVLGVVHGAEPGHGWPIAATYALDRQRKWFHGFVAGFLLGVGHLISSLAVVAAFFLAKDYFDLARIDAPLRVLGIEIGGPVSVVAGVLLIGLGIREYRHGHSHGHGDGHGGDCDHGHSHDGHEHDHGEHAHGADHVHDHTADHHATPADNGDLGGDDEVGQSFLSRFVAALPFIGGHSHRHPDADDLDERGLVGIVWTAFVLGFVHEEEFEIIGLCMGSDFCLELMLAYAVAVMVALIGFTLLLIAGYYRFEERVERYTGYLPAISAVVLATMGTGFVLGLF